MKGSSLLQWLRGHFQALRQDAEGAVAVLFALSSVLLIGMLAIGVEVGLWYYNHRHLQTVADAAAVAAGIELANSSGNAQAAALDVASLNGFTGTPTVNSPPTSGSKAGNSSAVEVVVSQQQPLLFSALFLHNAPNLSARAVALATPGSGGASSTACLLALNKTASQALDMSGNNTTTMPSCAIHSNSSSSQSVYISGSADITAAFIAAHGQVTESGNGHDLHGTPTYNGVDEVADPYACGTGATHCVKVPTYSGCDATDFSDKPKSVTTFTPSNATTPYVFCGGLSVKGTLTFEPGIYIIRNGDFHVGSGAEINGTGGVTIILTGDNAGGWSAMRENGHADFNLVAPTSRVLRTQGIDLSGIAIYRDRDAPSTDNRINGGAINGFTGAIYMPSSQMWFNGNARTGNSGCLQLIADTFKINGNAALGSTCAGTGVAPVSITKAGTAGTASLVE